MKKASIIIPAYNEEKYIEETLISINHPEVEIIVVCNGCTDKTSEIAKRFTKKVLKIKEKSVSVARNKGASIATGNILIFLDADIKLTKNTIQKIIDANFKLGTCKAIPNNNKAIAKIISKIKNISHHFGLYTGLIFCNKDLFKKVEGFNTKLKVKEGSDFIRKAKKYEKYYVVDTHVINNMRRFEKKGYFFMSIFWLKAVFKKPKEYEAVR